MASRNRIHKARTFDGEELVADGFAIEGLDDVIGERHVRILAECVALRTEIRGSGTPRFRNPRKSHGGAQGLVSCAGRCASKKVQPHTRRIRIMQLVSCQLASAQALLSTHSMASRDSSSLMASQGLKQPRRIGDLETMQLMGFLEQGTAGRRGKRHLGVAGVFVHDEVEGLQRAERQQNVLHLSRNTSADMVKQMHFRPAEQCRTQKEETLVVAVQSLSATWHSIRTLWTSGMPLLQHRYRAAQCTLPKRRVLCPFALSLHHTKLPLLLLSADGHAAAAAAL